MIGDWTGQLDISWVPVPSEMATIANHSNTAAKVSGHRVTAVKYAYFWCIKALCLFVIARRLRN